ncbi:citrate lyase subunit alpha [Azohydromonas lata]|uniref:Citrate lyase alpha chain n=1 Tax=Azohydromonas lata TaxID=45677 RepID=A0ABU5IHD3_9BURK|nr:citrate lyase subunit alpha [Azohydromonas lata]MDZ5457926.1 citrate lyase subunit alpha [Azohydromonas lata]
MRPYAGHCSAPAGAQAHPAPVRLNGDSRSKLLSTISLAFDACGIRDGATLSFHHHLRNGDQVLNLVLAEAAARGLRDLTVAASSLFPVHEPLVTHLRSGVVTRLHTAYMSGPVADAVSRGVLATPVVMTTHGGRARAIESGELRIDVAFIAAPAADRCGNLNGVEGPAACGPLGYAMVDAQHAAHVVAITDHVVPYPACPIDIAQERVDFVVTVDSIGDAGGILSGTTRPTTDPVGLQIAANATRVIEASGLLDEDFSFQTGAGGISLAVADQLRSVMRRRSVQGSFAAGGVTGYLCDMLDEGLFRALFDVQCFDLRAVDSYRRDARHMAMSASLYANPHGKGAVVDQLGAMILGAAQVDLDFNVNVTTGSHGRILGGSGGHADTADGARLAIVTTTLTSRAGLKLVERVGCITTPGSTVDVVVTEAGVAVNPRREEMAQRLKAAGLPVCAMTQLQRLTGQGPTRQAPARDGRIAAVVQYRDGTVIDVVRVAK